MQWVIPISREDKITSKRDNLYHVLESINSNSYEIDLPIEFLFSVHPTFNVADLNTFNVGDDFPESMINHFEEGEDDKNHDVPNVPTRPLTRDKATLILSPTIQAFIGARTLESNKLSSLYKI